MITESADIYFNENVASHSATIDGITGTVYGFYNREYVDVQVGRSVVQGYKPTFTMSSVAATDVSKGASVVVGGVLSFTVAVVQIHDEIESRLILEEA